MMDYVTHTHVKARGGKFTHTHLYSGEHTHAYLESPDPLPVVSVRPSDYDVLYDGYYAMAEKMRVPALQRIYVERVARRNAGERGENLEAQIAALEAFLSTIATNVVKLSS